MRDQNKSGGNMTTILRAKTLDDWVADAYRIMDRAVRLHKPSTVIASYSGGYDSMVVAHLANRWSKRYCHSAQFLTVAVDTLISADGWRDYITTSAKAMELRRVEVWSNPSLEDWKQRVRDYGFAYRESHHKAFFYYLKQRAFRMVLQHHKKHLHDRVLFLNGVRRAESHKRRNAPEISVSGAGVYANPIVAWPDNVLHQYRIEHSLPINPFYDTFGNSGDCLCNWHTQISLAKLRQHAPNVAAIIEPLDVEARPRWKYGYGEEPAEWRAQEAAGQLRLFEFELPDDVPYLCAGCGKHAPANADIEFAMLQRMEWA